MKPVWLVATAALLALGPAGPARATPRMTQVSALTVPNVVLDFDQMPAGGTTVADINAAFPDAGLVNLAFTIFATGNTSYNCNEVNDPGCVMTFPSGGGRGVKPDLLGGLTLIDPGTVSAGEARQLTIKLDRPITQWGIAIADKEGTVNKIGIYANGVKVGQFNNDPLGAPGLPQDGTLKFLVSAVPFDTIVLEESHNWVVPELAFEIPPPSCGDGKVQAGHGETCDPPDSKTPAGATCRKDCTSCGDGITNDGEECDGGADCAPDCTLIPFCGDKKIQADRGETCDPPDSTTPNGATCRKDCTFCGDGVTNDGEDCDGTPDCTPECKTATCTLKLEKFCSVPPAPDVTQCLGKVVSMKFEYTGLGCSASNNPQSGKATCTGGANGTEPVDVTVMNLSSGSTLADASAVGVGGIVFAEAANAGQTQFDNNIAASIRSGGSEIEHIALHTSCSQPLSVGDQFGSLRVVELTTTQGGTVTLTPPTPTSSCTLAMGGCIAKGSKGKKAKHGKQKCKGKRFVTAGNVVDYTYKVTNTGTTTVANLSVTDDKLGLIDVISSIAPGGEVTLTKMATINLDTTNIATATASVDGLAAAICEATAQATVMRQPAATECSSRIVAFRVQALQNIPGTGVLSFVGANGATANYDLPIAAGSVLMMPEQNGFTIDAGASTLGTRTSVFVDGVLTEIFHTSCSCPTNNFIPGLPACLDATSPDNPTGTKGEPSPLFLVEAFTN